MNNELKLFSNDNINLKKQVSALNEENKIIKQGLNDLKKYNDDIMLDMYNIQLINTSLEEKIEVYKKRLESKDIEINNINQKIIESEFNAFAFTVYRKSAYNSEPKKEQM